MAESEHHQVWHQIYAFPDITILPRLAESHEILAEVLPGRGLQTGTLKSESLALPEVSCSLSA